MRKEGWTCDFLLDVNYYAIHYSVIRCSEGALRSMQSWVTQLRKGLVELCVMAVLRDGEAYGYEILQRLSAAAGLAITESTVYPILSRLAGEGMLTVRAAPSPSGPPRRYYRLTPQGRARLREMVAGWKELSSAVDALVQGEKANE